MGERGSKERERGGEGERGKRGGGGEIKGKEGGGEERTKEGRIKERGITVIKKPRKNTG